MPADGGRRGKLALAIVQERSHHLEQGPEDAKGWAPGRMKDTQFKSGQKGWNWMPVGATRLIDGYLFRKVCDVSKVPYYVNWKAEHHLIWQKATGQRRVPRGHALIFKDGNRLNITLENLELITRKELRARNSIHALPEELKEVIRLKGAINRQITYQSRRQLGKEQAQRPA
jgi:HNH endonuclease